MLLLASVLASQSPNLAKPIDVSAVTVGTPALVAELDLGKLKGELRRVSWSVDGAQLYIQTADGAPPSEKRRHDIVAAAGGPVSPVDAEPEWATEYWRFKKQKQHVVRLTLLDQDKHRTTIDAGKGATLRAWSSDASRIAYLQKISRRTYRLMTATVTR